MPNGSEADAPSAVGTLVGQAHRPLSASFCDKALIKNTVSLSWRLGRAVILANKQAQIGNVGNILVDALGGSSTAKVLFSGKIVEVGRRVYKGHSIGEVVIASLPKDDESEDAQISFEGTLKSERSRSLQLHLHTFGSFAHLGHK